MFNEKFAAIDAIVIIKIRIKLVATIESKFALQMLFSNGS
jgi:hypothetical protein